MATQAQTVHVQQGKGSCQHRAPARPGPGKKHSYPSIASVEALPAHLRHLGRWRLLLRSRDWTDVMSMAQVHSTPVGGRQGDTGRQATRAAWQAPSKSRTRPMLLHCMHTAIQGKKEGDPFADSASHAPCSGQPHTRRRPPSLPSLDRPAVTCSCSTTSLVCTSACPPGSLRHIEFLSCSKYTLANKTRPHPFPVPTEKKVVNKCKLKYHRKSRIL